MGLLGSIWLIASPLMSEMVVSENFVNSTVRRRGQGRGWGCRKTKSDCDLRDVELAVLSLLAVCVDRRRHAGVHASVRALLPLQHDQRAHWIGMGWNGMGWGAKKKGKDRVKKEMNMEIVVIMCIYVQ